ncbi:hypothetical protein [Klebsiella pneumoniae]|uniref:hypothetical protein n=1 Tax=Klebsiella pneumoniae TaxID=573 RepID=UPI0015F28BD2|nr:hypothetical protein [Klebsiella pneumoniae]
MEKLAELKRAKLLALSLLLIAAAIFITTLALPPSPWVCLLYTSPSPRDQRASRIPATA